MRLGAAESVDVSMMLILDVYIYMHRVVSCREILSVAWPVIHPSQVSNMAKRMAKNCIGKKSELNAHSFQRL